MIHTLYWKIFQLVFIIILIFNNCSLLFQHEAKSGNKEFTIDVVSKNNQPLTIHVQYNITAKTLDLNYRKENGDHFSWMINFPMGLQIYKATMLGETDKGEPQYHFICFLRVFKGAEFVPFNVLGKLFQKLSNYSQDESITKPTETIFLDQQIKSVKLDSFGVVVSRECSEAQAVYTTMGDIKQFSSEAGGADFAFLSSAHLPAINISVYPYCREAAPLWELGCICRVDFLIDWYPCEVMLCDKPLLSEDQRFMCGMQGCKKRVSLQFYVDQRRSCFWN